MKIVFKILLAIIIALGLLFFVLPIKEKWVDDAYIYGDYFCNTYDGSCVSTSGHSTMEQMTMFEEWKYNRWVRNLNQSRGKS